MPCPRSYGLAADYRLPWFVTPGGYTLVWTKDPRPRRKRKTVSRGVCCRPLGPALKWAGVCRLSQRFPGISGPGIGDLGSSAAARD